MDYEATLDSIKRCLHQYHRGIKGHSLQFQRRINEPWFTNTLAWLLSPRGSHGYGSLFIKGFIKDVDAIRRSNKKLYKQRREGLFKFGKRKRHMSTEEMSLQNAEVATEFYLSKYEKGQKGPEFRFCDLAILDLEDNFILILENKLFSHNNKNQLQDYFMAAEERFERVQVREYVYLTLNGSDPKRYMGDRKNDYRSWVRMSWIEHILNLLKTIDNPNDHMEVANLRELLGWTKQLSEVPIGTQIRDLSDNIKEGISRCLQEELQLICKKGTWEFDSRRRFSLSHTRYPARRIILDLSSLNSVVLQCYVGNKPISNRLQIPLGINSKQFYSILGFEALHLSDHYFSDPNQYIHSKPNQLTDCSTMKDYYARLFDFIHEYYSELSILTMMHQKS